MSTVSALQLLDEDMWQTLPWRTGAVRLTYQVLRVRAHSCGELTYQVLFVAARKAANLPRRATLSHCVNHRCYQKVFLSLSAYSPAFFHHLCLSAACSIIPDMKFAADLKGEARPASLHKPHVSHYRNTSTLYFANLCC